MKRKIELQFYPLHVIGLILILTNSCKKDETSATSITDVDGNVYKIVTIGTQTWMAENLKVTKLNDGISITTNATASEWCNLKVPGYCWPKDSIKYKEVYGALYNWLTINSGKLCPKGWHVPSDADWTTLTEYLGGRGISGDKLKEAGTTHWSGSNVTADNETGFTALPAGERGYVGYFTPPGFIAEWWSSTEYDNQNANHWYIYSDSPLVAMGPYTKLAGVSVRCIKN